MRLPTTSEIRAQLEAWFGEALRDIDAETATLRALEGSPGPSHAPGVVAIGKAAEGMARAAVRWLGDSGMAPAGGLIITDHLDQSPHAPFLGVVGDHPTPGKASLAASDALQHFVDTLPPGLPVLVFLSGGASSLIAAPLEGITAEELRHAFDTFHRLGLDIGVMNQLRRQLTRWSNGRLASALGPRPVQVWVISDVTDHDLATVGSGPLLPMPVDFAAVSAMLSRPEAIGALAPAVRVALRDTPAAITRPVPHHVVADGRTALGALAAAARRRGLTAIEHGEAITNEATDAGAELGRWIHGEVRRHRLPGRTADIGAHPMPRAGVLHLWRSETTVKLPDGAGSGGRAQQFALAAAWAIGNLGWDAAATIMVAATDGRDGPTDAAGAIVHAGTLRELSTHGVDVQAALAHCDAYPALDAVGALLRTGRTGTNVADVVAVWLWNWY